ncbi:nicastrin [Platysternon megacephalum]|uniref:Nicastrin n=1 Tax=Platysternon megacephalum TaxID=55544 RepID=A0A4D9EIA3_9SAUR|nr:nicastrin [Platysternon megacephalum]
MRPAAYLLSLMLCALGTVSLVHSRQAGAALLTEMERRAENRFLERQNIVPLRLIPRPEDGTQAGHGVLNTRVSSRSDRKQWEDSSEGKLNFLQKLYSRTKKKEKVAERRYVQANRPDWTFSNHIVCLYNIHSLPPSEMFSGIEARTESSEKVTLVLEIEVNTMSTKINDIYKYVTKGKQKARKKAN